MRELQKEVASVVAFRVPVRFPNCPVARNGAERQALLINKAFLLMEGRPELGVRLSPRVGGRLDVRSHPRLRMTCMQRVRHREEQSGKIETLRCNARIVRPWEESAAKFGDCLCLVEYGGSL